MSLHESDLVSISITKDSRRWKSSSSFIIDDDEDDQIGCKQEVNTNLGRWSVHSLLIIMKQKNIRLFTLVNIISEKILKFFNYFMKKVLLLDSN